MTTPVQYNSTRLNVPGQQATADSNGMIVFQFPAVAAGCVWTGSLIPATSSPQALGAALWTVYQSAVAGVSLGTPIASWTAGGILADFQAVSGQQVTVVGQNLPAGLTMQMLWVGQQDSQQYAPVLAPRAYGAESPALIILQANSTGFSGLFGYSPIPGTGNLVFSISAAAGTDPFDNPYQAGFFLYEKGGNSLAGLMWNTVTGSQPLLALFPDSDFGFTDHAPFILSGDNNKGLSSEYQYLGMGPGAPPPASQSPEMITMWGASPDGTTSIPHFTVYGGASYDEIADFNDNGVIIENQTDGNTYKTGKKAYVANGVTVSSTSYETVLAIGTLAAGNAYHITGFANYHGNQAAGAPSFSWDGSGGLALGSQQNGYQSFALSGGGTHQDNGALGAADGPTFASATATYTYIWDVFVTVTTSGTLNITAAETISGDSWEIDYIYAQIEPY